MSSPLPPTRAATEAEPTAGRTRSAGRVRRIDEILESVVAEAGTRQLAPGELALLEASGPQVADRLSSLLAQRVYLDRRLVRLYDVTSDARLLMGYLLVVLHHRALASAAAEDQGYLRQFSTAMALRVLIARDQLRPDSPEAQAFNDARRACRRGRNRLLALLEALCASSNGFTETHQAFVHERLVLLAEQRAEWLVAARASVAFSNPPTVAEIQRGKRLRGLQDERERIQRRLEQLADEDAQLLQKLRDTPMRQREPVREDLRRVRDARRALLLRRREVREEIRGHQRALGYRRAPLVVQYLEALDGGLDESAARDARDQCLRRHESLIRSYTRLSLFGSSEQEAWTAYRTLLELLVTGFASISVELPFDAYFRRYPEFDVNRDWGYRDHWTGGTYPGHPENALDLTGQVGSPIVSALPMQVALPTRLREQDELPVPYQYVDSVLAPSSLSASNDAQDIFAKLSIGLLRRRGQRQPRSDAIEQVMDENEDSELAPEYVSDPLARHFDASRILGGLMYRRLTDVQNAGAIEADRSAILAALERQVASELGLASGTAVFRRDRADASSGHVGIARLITVPNHGEVLTAIVTVLGTPANSDRSHPQGLCHRIWRLLQALLGLPGVRAHRYGVSVTVEHRFTDPLAVGAGSGARPHPDLRITVFYTHLRVAGSGMRVVGGAVRAGDVVGELGTTGNAISGHLHLELSAKRGGVELGTLLPHEFFPLIDDYQRWVRLADRTP